MKLNELFNISEKKVKQLLKKIEELEIDLNEIEEKFSKGSGKGGQKQNKTSNRVELFHAPTGISVSCQRERQRNQNRFIALRSLIQKIEELKHPGQSKESKKIEKQRKQKKRRKRRTHARQTDEGSASCSS